MVVGVVTAIATRGLTLERLVVPVELEAMRAGMALVVRVEMEVWAIAVCPVTRL